MLIEMVYGINGKRIEELCLIRCEQCNKLIGHIKFPWDAGGGEEYYCLKCKPLTKKEKEALEYAEYLNKKRRIK